MDQLLKRKSTFLSSKAWLTNPCGSTQPVFQLTNVALQLSNLLEELENLSRNYEMRRSEAVNDLYDRMEELEDGLLDWLSARGLGLDSSSYKETRVNTFPSFEDRCSECASILRHVYKFDNLQTATTHCYIWILQLILQTALIDTIPMTNRPQRSKSTLIHQATETAYRLARSVAYLSAPEHKSAGVLACSGPLYWAQTWFRRQEDEPMEKFCVQLRTSLEENSPISLNLKRPVFTWWMLPSLFGE